MPWPAEPFEFLAARAPRRHLRALVSCDSVVDELPLVVDGSRRPSPAMAEHLASCLRCQAELAAYRRLLRLLRSLREDHVPTTVQGSVEVPPAGWAAPPWSWQRLVAGMALVGVGALLAAALTARRSRLPAGPA